MATPLIGMKFYDPRAVGLSPGACLYTYAAGTLTPLASYTDAGGLSANTNPVVCNAYGQADVFTGTSAYRFRLYSDTISNGGVLLSDEDNISGGAASSAFSYSASYVAGTLGQWLKDLALAAGSTFIGWIQSGTGAVTRTVSNKLRESITPQDFGSVGNNITNDGSSLRTAIASYGSLGGALVIPSLTFQVDASAGACLSIPSPISLYGSGGVYTSINPALASATDDTISISPSIGVDHTLRRVQGVGFANPNTGARIGRHGLFLNTQAAGANLAKFTFRDSIIGQSVTVGAFGLYHLNNAVNNVNGGMFGALIENSTIKGGIRLENSGDSNSIVHNILSGSGIGVWVTCVTGASVTEIQANNITTTGGAVRLDSGSRTRLIGNNIENLAAGAAANNNAAVVNFTGSSGAMYGGVVKENLISGFSATDATTLLRLRNCYGLLVQDNVWLSGAAGLTTGIDVGSDCHDVRIGANTYDAGITTKVLDNGVGTMGVVKTATLLNSWVAFSVGTASLKFIKSGDGVVNVYGCIKSGTTANGTLVATLPTGFAPSEIIRSPIMVVNAGTPQLAEMQVESDGSLRITYVLSSNQLNINFSFPSASLADAVSYE